MSRTGKIISWVVGILLLLVVVVVVIIATFDWNRLKPTINQKVSAELNRPFAIRGELGVSWERHRDEPGWHSWVPWPHVHAQDIMLAIRPPSLRSRWFICSAWMPPFHRWRCSASKSTCRG